MSTSNDEEERLLLKPSTHSPSSSWGDCLEHTITVSSQRTLAYATAGDPRSSHIVLRFHDNFDIGNIPWIPLALKEKGAYIIAPTLPGWGNTSPPQATTYAACVLADVSALLERLHVFQRAHSSAASIKLYIVGVGFGCLAAQVLYGAQWDIFPYGRRIAAMVLSDPFSLPGPLGARAPWPADPNAEYNVSVQYPYDSTPVAWLVEGLMRFFIFPSLKRTVWFCRKHLMGASGVNHAAFERWRLRQGFEKGQLERELAEASRKSIAKTWKGCRMVPGLSRPSNQWFDPKSLDDGHASRPIVVVSTRGRRMTQYIVENYKNVSGIYVDSELEAMTWREDDIWSRVFSMVDDSKALVPQ